MILYVNHAYSQQTNVVSGLVSQGTGGITEALKTRIVIPFTGVNSDDNHMPGQNILLKYSNKRLSPFRNLPTWMVEVPPDEQCSLMADKRGEIR